IMSLIRVTGTWSSIAKRFALSLRGFMKSSSMVSPGWMGGSFADFLAIGFLSVVVHDLYLIGAAALPLEADSPAVVDANAVLPEPVPGQRFEMVPRNRRQVRERWRGVEVVQFPLGNPFKPGVLSRPLQPKQ